MPEFHYRGRNQQAALIEGNREADSPETVAANLLREGIIPITVTLNSETTGSPLNAFLHMPIGYEKEATIDEVCMFARQMHALCKAGISVVNAITRLAEITKNKSFKKALNNIAKNTASGQTLSSAMAQYPKLFSNLSISIIAVGEESGELDKALEQVADYLFLESTTQKRIWTVFRYPLIVITAIGLAIIIINIFVIPSFAKVYSSFNAQLPLPTRIILATSHFMGRYWAYLLAGAIGIRLTIRSYLKTKQGDILWSRYQLKIPIIGPIIQKILLARFSRTFSLIMRAGITLSRGVTLIADAVDNAYARERILQMGQLIEHGENFTRAAAQTGLFSTLVLQMLAVGEEAGTLDAMLQETGEFYEREVDYDLETLGQKLEPVLLAAMAGLVLVLALGVFLPMWDLMEFAR